jgi:hypothetical protein
MIAKGQFMRGNSKRLSAGDRNSVRHPSITLYGVIEIGRHKTENDGRSYLQLELSLMRGQPHTVTRRDSRMASLVVQ